PGSVRAARWKESADLKNKKRRFHGSQPHRRQPDHLRAGHLRRLSRRMDSHSRAAYAADGSDERDLRDHHRGRDAGRRPHRGRLGTGDGHDRGGAGGGERVRRLPRHAAHAGNVQEEGAEDIGPAFRQGGQVMDMGFVSMNLVTMLYLVASVCFIQALKGLSHPTTARRGNTFGMSGMAIAAVTTIMLMIKLKAEMSGSGYGLGLVVLGVAVGGGIGATLARRVEMTKMPELVAAMHSLIGLAAVCIAVTAVSEPWAFGIAAHGDAI